MSVFKVGDKVTPIRSRYYSDETHPYLQLGRIYTVTRVEEGSFLFIRNRDNDFEKWNDAWFVAVRKLNFGSWYRGHANK